MTPDRVMTLLDAYGADPARWPEAEREAAMALISADPALAARRDEAAALDGLLLQAESPQPSADLARRILESAAGHGDAISAPAPQHGDGPGLLAWLRQASQQLGQQLWPQGAQSSFTPRAKHLTPHSLWPSLLNGQAFRSGSST